MVRLCPFSDRYSEPSDFDEKLVTICDVGSVRADPSWVKVAGLICTRLRGAEMPKFPSTLELVKTLRLASVAVPVVPVSGEPATMIGWPKVSPLASPVLGTKVLSLTTRSAGLK